MGLLHFLEKSECSICGITKNGLSMHSIYDGKICQNCLKKVDVQEDISSLSISFCLKRISLYESIQGTKIKMPPSPFTSIEEYENFCKREAYVNTSMYHKLTDKYYKDMNKLETLWSVLYNLKSYSGSKADSFEKLCVKNIDTFKEIYETFCIPYNTKEFDCVPAYKRLAMLYEKQGKFKESTMICLDAINHGVPNEYGDNGSGKMYARLARMAKKAKLLDNEEIIKYIK